MFLEELHAVKGLDPVADAFSGTVTSDIVEMKNYGSVLFVVHKGVGTTGTSTITVEASDDFSGSTTEAITFRYRAVTSTDVPGTLTQATTAGFTTTAGSSQLYLVEVLAEDLVDTGYSKVRLKAVEVADDPVLGGIAILMGKPRYTSEVDATAVA